MVMMVMMVVMNRINSWDEHENNTKTQIKIYGLQAGILTMSPPYTDMDQA